MNSEKAGIDLSARSSGDGCVERLAIWAAQVCSMWSHAHWPWLLLVTHGLHEGFKRFLGWCTRGLACLARLLAGRLSCRFAFIEWSAS